jgi:hypothetical protein
MARAKKLPSKPLPANRMAALLDEFIEWMRVSNATAATYFLRAAKLDPQGYYGGLAKQRLP